MFQPLLGPPCTLQVQPASDQRGVECGRCKGTVWEEEQTRRHWQCDWSGCAPGHSIQTSRKINILHCGYKISYYQLCNLVVWKLNRCLSSWVCFCEVSGLHGGVWSSGLGSQASSARREQGICGSDTWLWVRWFSSAPGDLSCYITLWAPLSCPSRLPGRGLIKWHKETRPLFLSIFNVLKCFIIAVIKWFFACVALWNFLPSFYSFRPSGNYFLAAVFTCIFVSWNFASGSYFLNVFRPWGIFLS